MGHDAQRGRARTCRCSPPDAPPEKAKELAKPCRDLGLEPVMMFSGIYPEAKDGLDVHQAAHPQAGAAGVPQVLTFGHTKGGPQDSGSSASSTRPDRQGQQRAVVVKQHGGETGTGEAVRASSAKSTTRNVKVNYDAGNVLDYLDKDPIPDIKTCGARCGASASRTTATGRRTRTAAPASARSTTTSCCTRSSFTGLTMPLACENIFAPLLPRPDKPEASTRWHGAHASIWIVSGGTEITCERIK